MEAWTTQLELLVVEALRVDIVAIEVLKAVVVALIRYLLAGLLDVVSNYSELLLVDILNMHDVIHIQHLVCFPALGTSELGFVVVRLRDSGVCFYLYLRYAGEHEVLKVEARVFGGDGVDEAACTLSFHLCICRLFTFRIVLPDSVHPVPAPHNLHRSCEKELGQHAYVRRIWILLSACTSRWIDILPTTCPRVTRGRCAYGAVYLRTRLVA